MYLLLTVLLKCYNDFIEYTAQINRRIVFNEELQVCTRCGFHCMQISRMIPLVQKLLAVFFAQRNVEPSGCKAWIWDPVLVCKCVSKAVSQDH